MKKYALLLALAAFCSFANGQGVAINNDNSSPDGSAMLDIQSDSKGLLIPRMTLAQRNLISNPASGLMVFQTDNTPGYYYNAGTPVIPVWERLTIEDDLDFVDGTGTATRIAFWSDANTLSSNADLFWDNNKGYLGVGTITPSGKLHSYVGNAEVTSVSNNLFVQNLATNTTTDGISKMGAYISSSGTFTGATPGLDNNNFGLFVDASGGDYNVGIRTSGDIGITAFGHDYGVRGWTNYDYGIGGYFYNSATGTGAQIGLMGEVTGSTGSSSKYAIYGSASGTAAINYGVYGTASGGTKNWAGFFAGNTFVSEKLAIGTMIPTAQLHTVGTVRFQSYTSGTLQVDASGNLSVGTGSALFTAGTGLSWSGTTLNSAWTDAGDYLYPNGGIGTNLKIADVQSYTYGVYAKSTGSYGGYFVGTSTGVFGANPDFSSQGFLGNATSGVFGLSNDYFGIYGLSYSSTGGISGVLGTNWSESPGTGLYYYGNINGVTGYSQYSKSYHFGVAGHCYNSATATYPYGAVLGTVGPDGSTNPSSWASLGYKVSAVEEYAGYFNGDILITEGLSTNGSFGTSGQVLTSSGGSAMSWTTPLTGSGTATRVAFWNGASSLSSNANLYWDNTNSRLGIGTSVPASKLSINGAGNANYNIYSYRDAGTGIGYGAYTDLTGTSGSLYGIYASVNFTGTGNPGYNYAGSFNAISSSRDNYGISIMADQNGAYGNFGISVGSTSSSVTYGSYGVYANASGGSVAYGLYCNGDGAYTGTWTDVSDEKFKRDIAEYNGALDKILKLRPVTYFMRTDEFPNMGFDEGNEIGFIAQEMENVFPTLVVNGAHPGVNKGDPDIEYKGINYIGLIPVLTTAIQEQNVMIQNLQVENEHLKYEISELEELKKEVADMRILLDQLIQN